MSRMLMTGLLFGMTLAYANPCRAQIEGPVKPEVKPKPPTEAPGPVPCGERTVCRQQFYLVEQQQATCLDVLSVREVDAGRRIVKDLEIDWKESKHVGTEIVMKSREVEREVTCWKTEAVQGTDPCTGCPCTTYKKVPVKHKVTITVYEPVCEPREFVVRVPVVKEVEREVQIKKLVLEQTQEPAIRKTLRVIELKDEVKVPIYPVPPMPERCPSGCPGPAPVPCCDR